MRRHLPSWLLIVTGLLIDLVGAALLVLYWVEPEHDSWGLTRLGLAFLIALMGSSLVALGMFCHLWHLRKTRLTPATFLTPDEERSVMAAVARFEARSSGEIRVHFADHVVSDLMTEARACFESLGMTATAQRNGVLFYLTTRDRRFAVLGDSGIHERVGDQFWTSTVTLVEQNLQAGRFAAGLIAGIEKAGAALAEHFPPLDGDVNELPDEISRG